MQDNGYQSVMNMMAHYLEANNLSVIKDSPKRFMVRSTQRRVNIFNAIAEKNHLDIHSIFNSMMLNWVLNNLDDKDLAENIERIFKD